MSSLPKGWAWSLIGEICEINLPPMPKTESLDSDLVSFVPMAAVAEESGAIDTSDIRPVHELNKKSYRQFIDGDVLIAKITPSMENGKGAVARGLAGGRGLGSTEFHVLRPRRGISPHYVLRFVLQRGFRAEAARHMTGTAGQLRVPAAYLKERPIPVPPSAEQERIVATIEEHFSRLDEAESMLRSASRRANRMRSAVLERGVAGEWPLTELSRVLRSLKNGIFVSRPSHDPPGVPVFRISAVRPLALDVHDVRYAHVPPEEAAPFRVEAGDLLFTRYSGNPGYVGSCAVVPPAASGTAHPDKLIRAVVDRDAALPEYLAIALTVGEGRRQIEKRLKTTAGQVGIAGGQLKTVAVPLPPVDEQERIVSEAEAQLTSIRAVDDEIGCASRRSVQLRRSILERAFSGRLVPQYGSDEPASVLLERIAAERAAAPNPGRRKRL